MTRKPGGHVRMNEYIERGVFATLETERKLGRVNFRLDSWDRYCEYAGQLLASSPLAHLQ